MQERRSASRGSGSPVDNGTFVSFGAACRGSTRCPPRAVGTPNRRVTAAWPCRRARWVLRTTEYGAGRADRVIPPLLGGVLRVPLDSVDVTVQQPARTQLAERRQGDWTCVHDVRQSQHAVEQPLNGLDHVGVHDGRALSVVPRAVGQHAVLVVAEHDASSVVRPGAPNRRRQGRGFGTRRGALPECNEGHRRIHWLSPGRARPPPAPRNDKYLPHARVGRERLLIVAAGSRQTQDGCSLVLRPQQRPTERTHLVDAREHRLKRERVRENGHRHPRGLLAGFLAERLGDPGLDRGEIRVPQACRGFSHAGLQRVEAAGDDALGDREIVDSARQQSAPRPALVADAFGAGEQAELVGRAGGCRLQIRLGRGLEDDGYACRDALFDDVPRISQARAESGDRIVLHGSRGQVLGLQHHRRCERVAHDQIRRAAALDRPVLFGGHTLPPRRVFRHRTRHKCLVEGAFAVGRHALRSVRVEFGSPRSQPRRLSRRVEHEPRGEAVRLTAGLRV